MEEWKSGMVEEFENLKMEIWKIGFIPVNSRLTPHASRLMPHASRLMPYASCLTPHASCLATADFSMRFALCSLPKKTEQWKHKQSKKYWKLRCAGKD